jgi:KipI family sensor histidine kinase inhibitor
VRARYLPAGDCALLVELDGEIGDALNSRLRTLESLLANGRLAGVTETVPSFRSLLVYYDPQVLGHEALCEALEARLGDTGRTPAPGARSIEIPCCYRDPELGFDLQAVAARLGLSPEALIEQHSAAQYLVYFIGFAPGQPYLTGLAPSLAIPRLESPRTRTPAGAVGIGGTQCCIYSVESPGGFWILGHTPVRVYDPDAASPILLEPGDRLRFRSVERDEYDAIAADVARGTYRPRIA